MSKIAKKNLVRKSLIKTIGPAKALMKKSPGLTKVVKNVVIAQLNLNKLSGQTAQYQGWLSNNYPDAIKLRADRETMETFTYKPKISILTPTYQTNIEHLRECILSVQTQIYDNWELCIVDDASPDEAVRKEIKKFAASDERIKYIFRTDNGHISKATNDSLAAAKGEFIGLLDHDDILWPNALFEVVKALNKDKEIDFLYSDEEKIEKNRQDHQNPFFKPDWNPEFLESVNYITHFSVLRKKLVEKIGGFRSEYDGAQDWDLFLRASHASKKIYHIPTVLYSWRMSETSTASNTDAKPYVIEAQKKAIQDSLNARNKSGAQVVRGIEKDYWNVVYPVAGEPLVSIVIPSKNQAAVLKRCINSIYKKTTYKNFEIVLVDTGSTDKKVRRWYKTITAQHSNMRVLDWPEQPFSYSRSCNYGAQQAKGEYLIMLNNDTEVLTHNWIELLLSDAQHDDVGPVGCKLYYPDGLMIQHAGIGIGFGGIAANSLSLMKDKQLGPMQNLYANTRHQVSAVTAACLMVKKSKFDEIQGFDEEFRITYNDVDLCLRLNEAGYRSVYNPCVQLLHYESISVGLPSEKKKRDNSEVVKATKLFKDRWRGVIAYDPHLNPNIERDNALFEVKSD